MREVDPDDVERSRPIKRVSRTEIRPTREGDTPSTAKVVVLGTMDGRAILDRFREALFETSIGHEAVRALTALLLAAQEGAPCDPSPRLLAELEKAELIERRGDHIVVY